MASKSIGKCQVRAQRSAMIAAAALFGLIVLAIFAHADVRPAKAALAPRRLQMAVSCLFSSKWMRNYSFTFLGYKAGDWISVRYYNSTKSNFGPTPGAYGIIVYSRDNKHGFLLDAAPNNRGGFFASQNDYSLRKNGSRWEVIEGEGGDVDYEAVERLVNRMSAKPLYRVQLVPGGKECTED